MVQHWRVGFVNLRQGELFLSAIKPAAFHTVRCTSLEANYEADGAPRHHSDDDAPTGKEAAD